eukprot:1150482-Pelagomonas_calceolata.AAC.1
MFDSDLYTPTRMLEWPCASSACFVRASDFPVATVCDRFAYGLRPELRGLCAYPVQGGFWQNLDDCIARGQTLILTKSSCTLAAPDQPGPKQEAWLLLVRSSAALPGHIIADCEKRKAKEATKGKAFKRGPESGAGGASKSQKV